MQAHDSLETVVVHVRCYEINEVTVFENLHEACQPDGTLRSKIHSKVDFFLFLNERFAEHFDCDCFFSEFVLGLNDRRFAVS